MEIDFAPLSAYERYKLMASLIVPRPIALYKAAALAQGANVVRGELGAPQTQVRAAEPGLQVDVPARQPEAVEA